MKITLLLSALIVCTSSAYTLSVSNTQVFGDDSLPIVDASGDLLGSGGFIRLGYFSSFSDSNVAAYREATASNLISDFVTFSGSGSAISEEFGLAGLTLNAYEQDFVNGAPEAGWTGQNVYALITNNADSEYGVFKFTDLIGQEDEAGAGSLTVNLESDQGSSLLGLNPGSTTIGATTYSNAFQLVEGSPIPEPTSGALLALGGLALVVRRKR